MKSSQPATIWLRPVSVVGQASACRGLSGRRAIIAFALAVTALAQHAERASTYLEAHDLKNAEAELRKAIAETPNDPSLLTSLGGVLGMQGDLKQANVYLAKAVK